jgi:Na+/melibiose symporter-like transporter
MMFWLTVSSFLTLSLFAFASCNPNCDAAETVLLLPVFMSADTKALLAYHHKKRKRGVMFACCRKMAGKRRKVQ